MPQNKKNVQPKASAAPKPKIRQRPPPPGFAGAAGAPPEPPVVVPTENAASDVEHLDEGDRAPGAVAIRNSTQGTDPEVAEPASDPEGEAESTHPEYAVGYKRPPLHSQFKKGQSGNPKGRPKGSKGFATIVREQLGAKVPVHTPQGPRRVMRVEGMLMKLVEQGAKGNFRALLSLLRMWDEHGPQEEKIDAAERNAAMTETDAAMLEALKEMHRAEFAQEKAGDDPEEDREEEEDRDPVEDDANDADEEEDEDEYDD